MKKIDAIYSELISDLYNICEDAEKMEAYWNALSEENQNIIDGISEKLLIEKKKIIICKNADSTGTDTIYDGYSELQTLLEEFNSLFSDYPGFNYSKFNYIITISIKIFENSSIIQDESVSVVLRCKNVNLSFEDLAYITNVAVLDNSIAWFSPVSPESLTKLVGYNSDINCWYALLCEVDNIDFQNNSECIFYCETHFDAGISCENICALLKIHMASAGLKTIPSLIYSNPPSNSSLESYCPSESYMQFSDIVGILGEYNNREDILSKYMSIYHVIENLMFKQPIVKLERSSAGSMFSMRDFKRLYKSVDVDEQKAMKNLFKEAFNIQFNGIDFKSFAYQEWNAFLVIHGTTGLDDFLKVLSINDRGNLNAGNFFDFISRIVYQIRCSIVHNKETEFHISSESYPIGCKLLLENFILKFLEELIFLLMSKENSLVWYKTNSISLWRESA